MTDLEDLPHDIGAEQKTLSAMLDGALDSGAVAATIGGWAIDAAAELLTPGDFYRPAHQIIFQALVTMRQAGTPVAVETVRDWIDAGGDSKALGGLRSGEYLLNLCALSVPGPVVESFALIVGGLAVRRRWIEAAAAITQAARTPGDIGDLNAAAAEAAARAETFAADMPGAVRLQTPSQLAGSDRAKADPVIPGLDGEKYLNRMDRVLVVGAGGSGKTVWLLQHAAAAAVGVHPFLHAVRFDPVRVLVLDLELPTYQLNDNLNFVFRQARLYGDPEARGRFQVFHRPRGLNLLKPANGQLLTGLIRQHRPHLIVGGPVYKMHPDQGERGDHTGVMDYWDEIRDRFGVTLMLETHPPKKSRNGVQDWTPAGASRWSDWAEIGHALVPVKDKPGTFEARHFRGKRDRNRPWPEFFKMSAGWPWEAQWPPGTLGMGEE